MSDADLSQLDALASRLRALDSASGAIAAEARADVEVIARSTAAAGTTPEGESWKPTKDGRRALPNVAGSIVAVVSGTTRAVITLVLSGPYIYHQKTRPILPDPSTGVPKRYTDAIRAAAVRVARRTFGGRS